jgi:hypothetical protein
MFSRRALIIALAFTILAQSLHARVLAPELRNKQNTTPPHAVQLWNGRNLSGWKFFSTNAVDVKKIWSVTNGVLHLEAKGNGYLRTEKEFSDYHLHVEWRWTQTNANSGVFVHIGGADAIWPRSVECQLKSGSAGELVGQGGVDFPAPTISGKKRAKIKISTENPVGEWNRYDIYCRSNTIEAQVNGARQNLIEKVSAQSGAVGLQLEGYPVEFRSLWLEPL